MPGKTFYQYCAQNENDVEKSLSLFLSEKNRIKLLNEENGVIDEVYEFCEKLMVLVKDPDPKKSSRTRYFLKFLELDVLEKIIAGDNTPPVWLEFYRQILSIYYLSAKVVSLEIYSEGEIMLIGLGKWEGYEDAILNTTLAEILNGNLEYEKYLPALKSLLPKDSGVLKEESLWDLSFTLGIVFYILWNNISLLNDEFRDLLLERFYYVSIVCGVPVLDKLNEYLASFGTEGKKAVEQKVLTVLNKNKEYVPTSINGIDQVLLPEIVKIYHAVQGQDAVGGFKHEEFLKRYYETEKGRDIYRGWLRTAMGPYIYLQ